MVDYEKIGKRIQEQRKNIRQISQEKMAEALGMYQADISNLEKAKTGSGITDLSKLDLIADYFDMPLEALLFGRRQDQMEKYYGAKMQLKESTQKWPRKHDAILRKLMGVEGDVTSENLQCKAQSFDCGPYRAYVVYEHQQLNNSRTKSGEALFDTLVKPHIYVIYQDEVIACLTADTTYVVQHFIPEAYETLKTFILPDVFDLDETVHILNPYSLLFTYSADEEEREKVAPYVAQRTDAIIRTGEERVIYYVENAYVRDDCRGNGIFRMMIDLLKTLSEACIIRLSLEPTSGAELDSEYACVPTYEASALGQIHLNASIAEHLGFTIDPVTVDRKAERLEENGTVIVETVPVRRNAYYFPKRIRSLMNGDGDLLALGRARKRLMDGDVKKPSVIDIYHSAWKKLGFVSSIKLDYEDETVYAFARGMDWKSHWVGVSRDNPSPNGDFVETIERYDALKDAVNSKYFLGMMVAEQLLGSGYFGTVKPEDVRLDLLQ